MKVRKSYSARIGGNTDKICYIKNCLSELQKLSEFVFNEGPELWFDFNLMYKICRNKFPFLKSKILQNFLQKYRPVKGKRFPKKPISPSIVLDYQNFNLQKNDSILTNYWIRFNRKNFPIFGKYLSSKISKVKNIKFSEILKRKNKLYVKLISIEEIKDPVGSENPVGLDINSKRIVLSNNNFYSLKRLNHRKIEHHKNNKDINNFTKDCVHKLTSQIVKDISNQGSEVLVLEDLNGLRKSASKKRGTSKGKKLNFIINSLPFSMFRSFLEYKCLNQGIKVEIVNPAFTSQKCSSCGSMNTKRPTLFDFKCNDCKLNLDADLNGSRNIQSRYMQTEWATVNPAHCQTLN